jgi:CBS domain-containing protein/gamma-glutamylcysteine synthetase
MGEEKVKIAGEGSHLQLFMRKLLLDIEALGKMLDEGWFELDATRIGAEQELCLIDSYFKPSPNAMDVLDRSVNPLFTSELAKFNIEINTHPLHFSADCFSQMHNQLSSLIAEMRKTANELGSDLIMSGILPTIRRFDLEMDNLTPKERYYALVNAINQLRGEAFELRISGIDELNLKFDSPLLEACNTGWQVHLQVKPEEFVKMYNIAQAITGPVLAAAVNSPMLFGRRLWKETRIALFQQSIDTRSSSDHLREMSPRVTFGNNWIRNSILDIYKEDIMRYRVILRSESEEDVFEKINKGIAPELHALKIHNGTVYRWNRPCYGIGNGKAHLRIENRVFPSGPSLTDEIANAAFWLGLMNGLKSQVDDVSHLMEFEHAKSNFYSAAQMGLETTTTWFNGKRYGTGDLILNELLPLAKQGLADTGVDRKDADHYLGIVQQRVESGHTGSRWMLDSFASLIKQSTKDEATAAMTASMLRHQMQDMPIHKWPLASLEDLETWHPSTLLVEEFMTTDLFTVQKDDIVELVAEMIDWQRIRFVPVEDKEGRLTGLMTSRLLLRYYNRMVANGAFKSTEVKDVMIQQPITIKPDASILDAMALMEKNRIGCLPVVANERLVGMITEANFLTITKRLFQRLSASTKKVDL